MSELKTKTIDQRMREFKEILTELSNSFKPILKSLENVKDSCDGLRKEAEKEGLIERGTQNGKL